MRSPARARTFVKRDSAPLMEESFLTVCVSDPFLISSLTFPPPRRTRAQASSTQRQPTVAALRPSQKQPRSFSRLRDGGPRRILRYKRAQARRTVLGRPVLPHPRYLDCTVSRPVARSTALVLAPFRRPFTVAPRCPQPPLRWLYALLRRLLDSAATCGTSFSVRRITSGASRYCCRAYPYLQLLCTLYLLLAWPQLSVVHSLHSAARYLPLGTLFLSGFALLSRFPPPSCHTPVRLLFSHPPSQLT